MKKIRWRMGNLVVIAGVSLAVYYFFRLFFFFDAEYGVIDTIFAALLLIGETYMVIHSFGFIINVFRINRDKNRFRFKKFHDNSWPSVAVVVAVRHEPREVLEQTLITLKSLNYQRKKIYLLEGSSDDVFIAQDKELCEQYGVIHFTPNELRGAKAGTVNQFIETMHEKYIAIFDADQNPMPSFLKETVALAEKSDDIAFIQTPQLYSNIGVGPIAKGSAMQQSVFYESICEAKASVNAMFCCGTNVLFRTEALKAVGGFDETSITEDFATSVKLHIAGYRSIYYNHVRVFGMAPESLPAYFRQQARWSAGTAGVFARLIKYFFTNPCRLSLNQWWEYFLSGSYYFVGWAFFLLMLSPIAYLLFDLPSYFVSSEVYIMTFVPYFTMSLAVFYGTMRKRNYGLSEVYHGIILGSLSFPILMVATVKGMFSKKMTFAVTPKGKVDQLSFPQLWPWTGMILLNALAIVFGIWKLDTNPWAIAVNMFWCGYHIFILSQIYYFNELPTLNLLYGSQKNTE